MRNLSKQKYFKWCVLTIILGTGCKSQESSDCMRIKSHPFQIYKSIQVRKISANEDLPFLPEVYNEHILKANPSPLRPNDTLFLLEHNQNTIEFEAIAADSSSLQRFTLKLFKDGTWEKVAPYIDKKRESYSLSSNKVLAVFMPWVYISRGDGGQMSLEVESATNGCYATNIFPISVLSDGEYEKFISNRVNKGERIEIDRLKSKYEARIDQCWVTERFGRKGYNTYLDVKKLFAGKQIFDGIYSSEYVVYDGNYRVTLTGEYGYKVRVEPKHLAL